MNFWITLSFILIICETNFAAYNQYPYNRPKDKIKINKMIDESLDVFQNIVKRFGFDPMKISNITDTISGATVNLTNGIIKGESKFERAGDFILRGLYLTIRLYAKIHFKEVQGKFNYSVAWFMYEDEGELSAKIYNVTAILQADVALLTLTIENFKLKILNFDHVEVAMKSRNSYNFINLIKNIIANAIIPYYEKNIVKIVERALLQTANNTLNEIDRNYPEWIGDWIADRILPKSKKH